MKKIRKNLACGHGDLNKGTDFIDLISFKINVIIKRLIELENIVKRIYKQKFFMVVVSFYIPIINLLIDCDFSQSGCSFRTFLNGDTHIF